MKFAVSSEGSSITIVHKLLILLHRKGRSVVDSVCGDTNIANLFAAKFSDTLNTHSSGSRSTLLSSVQSSLSASDLSSVCVSEELVAEAIFLTEATQIRWI